jgi:HEAT repeat protein
MDFRSLFELQLAMPYVKLFLSYSTIDKAFVERLASDLQRVSVGVWYDKWEIRVGDSLLDKIASAIEENDYLALILSPTSVESEWVKREVNAALMRELSQRKAVVLPVMIQDCEIPTLLREKKYADFRASYEEGFEQLLLATSPESPAVVRHSKEFRTAQYLISGLSATDNTGTNTLNVSQLKRIYPLRVQLRAFLGPEEKRLLFWSAAVFRRVNPLTPSYMQISTPVWGLIDGASPTDCARWTMEGLAGVLFDGLIPHYRWARNQLSIDSTRDLKIAGLTRREIEKDYVGAIEPISKEAIRELLIALAEADRNFFDHTFLPVADKDVPYRAEAIEATAWFQVPLEDSFYFLFIDSNLPIALAAFRALVRLKRPSSVSYLRRLIDSQKIPTPSLDSAFSEMSDPNFILPLEAWLNDNPPIEVRARVLVSLGNAGFSDSNRILECIRSIDDPKTNALIPTLVRVLGNTTESLSVAHLLPWLELNPIAAEAAVFGLAHIGSADANATLRQCLQSRSETVLSAAIEALGKIDRDALADMKRFETHQSQMVRGSYYRTLASSRALDEGQLVLLRQDHSLIRLTAYRACTRVASEGQLDFWLNDTDTDELLRVCADEVRFAPGEYQPDWIRNPKRFDPELARFPVRLTDFDPGYTWIATSVDLDRLVNIVVMGRAT